MGITINSYPVYDNLTSIPNVIILQIIMFKL